MVCFIITVILVLTLPVSKLTDEALFKISVTPNYQGQITIRKQYIYPDADKSRNQFQPVIFQQPLPDLKVEEKATVNRSVKLTKFFGEPNLPPSPTTTHPAVNILTEYDNSDQNPSAGGTITRDQSDLSREAAASFNENRKSYGRPISRDLRRRKKKQDAFFGERPPDELIADKLEQFFPDIPKLESHENTISAEDARKHMSFLNQQGGSTMSSVSKTDSMSSATGLKSIVQAAMAAKRMTRISMLMVNKNRFSSLVRSSVLTPGNRFSPSQLSGLAEIESLKHESALSLLESKSQSNNLSVPTPIIPRIQRPTITRWTQGQIIGQGAFGKVFHGLNLDTGEIMAVKQVLIGPANDTQKKKREDALRREMELLEEMDHIHIVRYLGT